MSGGSRERKYLSNTPTHVTRTNDGVPGHQAPPLSVLSDVLCSADEHRMARLSSSLSAPPPACLVSQVDYSDRNPAGHVSPP